MEKILKLNSNAEAIALYGSLDENLRFAEKEYHVRISARNRKLKMIGDKGNVEQAYRFFSLRLKELREGGNVRRKNETRDGGEARDEDASASAKPAKAENISIPNEIHFFHKGKIIAPRSPAQGIYLNAVNQNDIVFGVGPAGTGKTYLAMAAAIDHLKKKRVQRIVLTRPAVEAGESLGFLPGDLHAKVNPYLRPLYDALYDMIDYDEASRYVERGMIEVAPLAYMRGRTLNDSFVILDEAQNCTHAQMKMFLTRLGNSSKTVVTGDVTQVDLPGGKKSGLISALSVLANVQGIQFVYMTETDVVRHPLVQKIITAYDRYDGNSKQIVQKG